MVAVARKAQFQFAATTFAGAGAAIGRFNAMVNGIAQQVHHRIDNITQDLAVHHGVTTAQNKIDLLVRRATGLAHTALQSRKHGFNGHHAGFQHTLMGFTVELPLGDDHIVELTQLAENLLTHFFGIDGRFDHATAITVQLVILVHFQGIEVIIGFAMAGKIFNIHQFFQLRSQLVYRVKLGFK